jgi:hypothetical protein
MNNRDELQTEYFDLIRTLNKTNRKANQQTELSFSIRCSGELRQLMCTTNKESYLRIANHKYSKTWSVDTDFKYQQIAKYILRSNDLDQDDINLAIINCLRRIFAI